MLFTWKMAMWISCMYSVYLLKETTQFDCWKLTVRREYSFRKYLGDTITS